MDKSEELELEEIERKEIARLLSLNPDANPN